VTKLLTAEAGVDWNSKDTVGRTPLSYAVSNGHETLVAMLLNNKCVVPDLKDHYGATPLSLAARSCRVDVVKLLLATHCVNLNSQDSFGHTPLWWAGNTGTAQALLEYAGRRGISIRESVTRIAASSTPSDKEIRSCDVCMLSIQEKDAYYNCSDCNGGDFDICLECYRIGGRCLEIGHRCLKKKDG
ncbi:ankyrin repeat-containing domain protein, partial [Bisporella sp. PMI_857]